jgi:hypothetical protein
LIVIAVKTGIPRLDIFVRKVGVGNHADKDVKMISHNAKAQYFSEVQRTESANQIDHPAIIDILKRESVQSGSGHDRVNRSLIRD